MARARAKRRTIAHTRAQACADFLQKKARARRRLWRNRALMGMATLLVGAAVTQHMWLPKWAFATRLEQQAQQALWQASARSGFALRQIHVHQRNYTAMDDVRAVLDMQPGAPILALDLDGLQTELEAIAEVKHAYVSRKLPADLHVMLDERVPVARWQHENIQRLIDAEGVVLNDERYQPAMKLPVVVGGDVPQHMQALLDVLEAEPLLYAQVAAAMRVGARRWNIRLVGGVTVMLPEENPALAWQRFANLVRNDAILTRAIGSIDLRMEDRIFVTPMDEKKATPVRYRTSAKGV